MENCVDDLSVLVFYQPIFVINVKFVELYVRSMSIDVALIHLSDDCGDMNRIDDVDSSKSVVVVVLWIFYRVFSSVSLTFIKKKRRHYYRFYI